MSSHQCKCGSTVFTLESPKSQIAGFPINTGLKLATCMVCGSQDRPEEIDKHFKKKAEVEAKEAAIRAEMLRRKQYELQHPCEQLLAEWLKMFNKYSQEKVYESESDRYHRR